MSKVFVKLTWKKQMATKRTSPVDAFRPTPPGISWTAPEKSQPWLNPPRRTDISEIAEMYISTLASKAMANDLLDSLETGVPLASIAETFMLAGVYGGEHTIDAGILVIPVIIEMLKAVAKVNKIDVVMFSSDVEEADTTHPRNIRQAVKDLMAKKEEAMPMEEAAPMAVQPMPSTGGLMARKQKAGE